ncbi:MAG: hypothetical protein QOH04_944 [Sphingomonadales bacterium]|jgi:hypothetical protein|nr:hypothetical protein [Sphingomonadales bacterium]
MGYALNELANLPVDNEVHFYIFVINGEFREPLYEMIERNFMEIARSIGNHAVIALGTHATEFTTSVARKYLGEDNSDNSFRALLPALLITNDHPDRLKKESMRLVVPLRDAESRFGDWSQFFSTLAAFVRGENDEFLRRFDEKENFIDAANKIVNVKPGAFGISLNVNELVTRWRRKSAGRSTAP